MIFKNWNIVIEDGQLGSTFYFEKIIGSWVINIMGCSRNESTEDVNLAHLAQLVNILLVKHKTEVLNHICCMDLVVVGVISVGQL